VILILTYFAMIRSDTFKQTFIFHLEPHVAQEQTSNAIGSTLPALPVVATTITTGSSHLPPFDIDDLDVDGDEDDLDIDFQAVNQTLLIIPDIYRDTVLAANGQPIVTDTLALFTHSAQSFPCEHPLLNFFEHPPAPITIHLNINSTEAVTANVTIDFTLESVIELKNNLTVTIDKMSYMFFQIVNGSMPSGQIFDIVGQLTCPNTISTLFDQFIATTGTECPNTYNPTSPDVYIFEAQALAATTLPFTLPERTYLPEAKNQWYFSIKSKTPFSPPSAGCTFMIDAVPRSNLNLALILGLAIPAGVVLIAVIMCAGYFAYQKSDKVFDPEKEPLTV